jgi:hypothetical protein
MGKILKLYSIVFVSTCLLLILNPSAQASEEVQPNGRVPVACSVAGSRDLVLVPFGQSNAANELGDPYAPGPNVLNFNFADGRCYHAQDPLLGATMREPPHIGSIWSILGDLLLETGRWDRIIVAPVAVSGSFLEDWIPGHKNFRRLETVLAGLDQGHLKPDSFLWIQGEAEAFFLPDGPRYQALFRQMAARIHELSPAPIYIAVETTCRKMAHPLPTLDPAERVRQLAGQMVIENAQRALVDEKLGLLAGPNLDLLSTADRWDSCHLNAFAQRTAAELWRYYLLTPDAAARAQPFAPP